MSVVAPRLQLLRPASGHGGPASGRGAIERASGRLSAAGGLVMPKRILVPLDRSLGAETIVPLPGSTG
jgi:hypothetical protein